MIHSMTGFAAGRGTFQGYSWTWDIRSVNGKGLDLRLRCPDWIEGLEPLLRKAMSDKIGRGNVSLTLRVTAEEKSAALFVDNARLQQAIEALQSVQSAASGLVSSEITAAEILKLPGVLTQNSEEENHDALRAALLADLPSLLDEFLKMRQTEGAALHKVIAEQLAQIKAMVEAAIAMAPERADKAKQVMADALSRISGQDSVDPDRVAQELALLAIKADVTEELDRLTAHIAAAQDMIGQSGPIGRKLDFLMQEFNREANTLCSKSQYAPLTAIGLDLKVTIDQMREQVQNVE